MRSRVGLSTLLVVLGSAALLAGGPQAADLQVIELDPDAAPPTPEQLRSVLPYLSNPAVRADLALSLGLKELAGKPLVAKPADAWASLETFVAAALTGDFDHWVSGDATSIRGQQTNPSMAVNPLDENIVVVAAENTHSLAGNATDCTVYVSLDGGNSYSYGWDANLFVTVAPHTCSSPKVAFSPDGTTLYLSFQENGGATPVVDLFHYDGFNPTSAYILGIARIVSGATRVDSLSLGVHTWDADGTGAPFGYQTWTNFSGTACSIEMQRFSNYGSSLGPIVTLATSPTCTNANPLLNRVLQGPTIAGGPGTQVLACWFDAGKDGYSTSVQPMPPVSPTPVAPLNKFNIACRSSNDRGLTFAGNVSPPESVTPPDYTRWIYAAKDVASEVPYWLGPSGLYFYTGAAQFPSLTIDHLGAAHLVFSYAPSPLNRFKSDSANVAYVKSTASTPTPLLPTIYSKWSAKTVLATGFGAQLYPTIASQHVNESGKPYLYVGWIDTAASSALGVANANSVYACRFRYSTTGGPSFARAESYADHASASDYISIGKYLGATAGPGIFHLAWTDNRTSFSKMYPREHICADRE